MSVRVGDVCTFENVYVEKEQFQKIMEEAAEVYGAWQRNENDEAILMECADVVQAVCNLVHAMGFDDLHPWMSIVKAKNEGRGRVYSNGEGQ